MPNKNRQPLASLIHSIGGYSGRHDFYALSWDVGVYHSVDDDFTRYAMKAETLAEFTDYHGKLTAEDMPILKHAIKLATKEWKRANEKGWLWEWIVEAMRRDITDYDGIYYVSPDVATQFNISQDYKFDATFEFHGRSGKHLCLTRFEGCNLEMPNDALCDILTNTGKDYDTTGEDFPNRLCLPLLAYLTECERMFSSERVKESFEYCQRYEAAQMLERVWDEATERHERKQAKKAKRKAKLEAKLLAIHSLTHDGLAGSVAPYTM